MELVKKGSVKDIYTENGELFFHFSDRYSIFDWGEMPDKIPNKGACLLSFTKNIFEFLETPNCWKDWTPRERELGSDPSLLNEWNHLKENGLKTHYCEIYSKDGADYLSVDRVSILEPKLVNQSWDYSSFKEKVTGTLVPLEIIFRFGVPEGSSLLKRAKDKEYLKQLGLPTSKDLKVGDKFQVPVIEFSTKLEEYDRYISFEEAKEISGMTDREFETLKARTTLLALRLKDYFLDFDIELWDGKFEFAFDKVLESENRDFVLVDSVGPDELRLMKNGVQLSKEVLRQFYLKTDWYKKLSLAKEMAKSKNRKDWKTICTDELSSKPENLEEEKIKLVENMYLGLEQILIDQNYKFDEVLNGLKRNV